MTEVESTGLEQLRVQPVVQNFIETMTDREHRVSLYSVIAVSAAGVALETERRHPVVSFAAGAVASVAAGVVVAEAFLKEVRLPFTKDPHESCLDLVRLKYDGTW